MTKFARPRRSSRRLAWMPLVGLWLAFAGCRPAPAPPTNAQAAAEPIWEPRPVSGTPDSLDSIARGYVRAAQALGERDPDSLDFSIVPEDIRAAIHRVYPDDGEIVREASSLEDRLRTLKPAGTPDETARIQFLSLQLASVKARAAMLHGQNLDFDSEAQALFATTRQPDTEADAAHRKQLRAQILALLPAFHGAPTLSGPDRDAARYADYDRRFLVPAPRLEVVMSAALAACRDRTLSQIKMPEGESVELKFVHRVPWSAFSRYQGHAHSIISLNLDLPVTVDAAFELACHEGYPGHHVFNTLHDQALGDQKHWPEAQIQLTFSPQSYVSEAAAAYAPRLAFTTAERTKIEHDILFPLAGLPPNEAERYVRVSSLIRELAPAEPAIARDYLDGSLEFVRACQQLAAEVLMAHPEATLLYLNEYRSYMLAYTDGPRRIAATLPAPETSPTPERTHARWQAYEKLMTMPWTKLP